MRKEVFHTKEFILRVNHFSFHMFMLLWKYQIQRMHAENDRSYLVLKYSIRGYWSLHMNIGTYA